MGRRRKHHGGSRLASDQIPGENQNNNCLRPCHSLWYHHQAFRDDTPATLLLTPFKCKRQRNHARYSASILARIIHEGFYCNRRCSGERHGAKG